MTRDVRSHHVPSLGPCGDTSRDLGYQTKALHVSRRVKTTQSVAFSVSAEVSMPETLRESVIDFHASPGLSCSFAVYSGGCDRITGCYIEPLFPERATRHRRQPLLGMGKLDTDASDLLQFSPPRSGDKDLKKIKKEEYTGSNEIPIFSKLYLA